MRKPGPRRVFPEENVTKALREVCRSSTFKELNTIRNVLSHRGTPGRVFSKNLPAESEDVPISWGVRIPIPINEKTTAERRIWLSASVDKLVTSAEEFAETKLN